MLTIFTFGYWGWGGATSELIRAINTAERRKGFSTPVFFDIRLKRSVRAKGFRADAFERLLPRGRYRWFPRLGNINIVAKKRGVKIKDPFASRILFEEALKFAKANRRVIIFCACEFPNHCHRRVVAKLLLKEAERTGHPIRIAEWPGGEPIRSRVRVTKAIFKGICGNILNVRLSSRSVSRDVVGLPWGSIVDVESGKESVPIISGPAKFQNGWILPIWEQHEPNTPAAKLRRASEKWLRSHGFTTIWSSPRSSRHKERPKAISVRQPWAHAIIHLGKDVENRPWRRNYAGPLLIHASAYQEPNPHGLLSERMANPPSQNKLTGLPTGAIIGVVDLFDYIKNSTSKWHDNGYWHLLLRNARPIKPVECKGQLGLWTPRPSVIKKLPGWFRKRRLN